jgi:hypothetical protein
MMDAKERIRILKLIEEGKVSPAEGVRLLEQGQTEPQSHAAENPSTGPRWLRVLVTDTESGKTRVNVRLPVNLVNAGVKLGAHLSTAVEEIDMDQIREYIRRGFTGQVLDVFDDEEDERVQIILE